MLTTCPQCNFSPEIPEILRQSHICYHWLSVSGISKIMHCGILIDMPYSKWLINDSCSHNYDHAVYSINKDCLYEAKCTFSSHLKQWYSIKSVLNNSFENAIFIFNNNITIYNRILSTLPSSSHLHHRHSTKQISIFVFVLKPPSSDLSENPQGVPNLIQTAQPQSLSLTLLLD